MTIAKGSLTELFKKKATWAGIVLMITALGTWLTGDATGAEAIRTAVEGAGVIFLRHAIAKGE